VLTDGVKGCDEISTRKQRKTRPQIRGRVDEKLFPLRTEKNATAKMP
jgi:hypothetical protein